MTKCTRLTIVYAVTLSVKLSVWRTPWNVVSCGQFQTAT